jgi:peptidoglycan hydrolase CwlO-like protein
MFLLAATLLVVCLLLFGALLGARSMLDNAKAEIESLGRFAKRCERRIAELDKLASQVSETIETLTKQRDNAIEEMTRLTCELEVAKLSLRNAQDQFAEQVEANKRLRDDRHEYRSMLVSIAAVLVDQVDLLHQVESGTEWQDEQS